MERTELVEELIRRESVLEHELGELRPFKFGSSKTVKMQVGACKKACEELMNYLDEIEKAYGEESLRTYQFHFGKVYGI